MNLKEKLKGKLRLDLLPIRALEEVARALQSGIDLNGYPAWDWLTVENWQDIYFGATLRHLFAWRRGEKKDPKTGLHPLAHAGADVLILLTRSINDYCGLGRNVDKSVGPSSALHGGDALESRHSEDNGPGQNRASGAKTRRDTNGKSKI